jgi:hypothetical protein
MRFRTCTKDAWPPAALSSYVEFSSTCTCWLYLFGSVNTHFIDPPHKWMCVRIAYVYGTCTHARTHTCKTRTHTHAHTQTHTPRKCGIARESHAIHLQEQIRSPPPVVRSQFSRPPICDIWLYWCKHTHTHTHTHHPPELLVAHSINICIIIYAYSSGMFP